MFKRGFRLPVAITMLGLLAASVSARMADLQPTELAWLDAALPVLAFARREGLPLDLIVQPQPTPGETPMGLAFIDGRCKLVLSMRGNPVAQATLDSIPAGLRGPVVEAIAAHEVAHCWRHVARQWGSLPAAAGYMSDPGDVTRERADSAIHGDRQSEALRTQREEAFADLVGLAWTLRHHPDRYAQVHAWKLRFRAHAPWQAPSHDTRIWLRLAADTTRFKPTPSIFEQVEALWLEGLRGGR